MVRQYSAVIHMCTWFNTKVICSSNTKGQKAHHCILKEMFRISYWRSSTTIYLLSWARIIALRIVGKLDFESASLTSSGSPRSFIRVAFPILSAEHNMFVCDLFWKWDPFVLTDACSGAAAKAQLDFLDCHARLVIYPLLSYKPNYLFVTLENNYLPQRYTMLNSGAGQQCGSQTRSRWKCKPKMPRCYSNQPGLEYLQGLMSKTPADIHAVSWSLCGWARGFSRISAQQMRSPVKPDKSRSGS